MITWVRKLLGSSTRPEQSQRLWNARLAALEGVFGKSDGTVYRASAVMRKYGFADVLRFRDYVPGVTYITSDLIGDAKQVPNRWGQYELMICLREESDWAPALLSRLGAYTHETTLHPGDTMDLGDSRPEESNIAALLFQRPNPPGDGITIFGSPASLLLCVGITQSEFDACKNFGTGVMGRMLRENNIFPYTVLDRDSVA